MNLFDKKYRFFLLGFLCFHFLYSQDFTVENSEVSIYLNKNGSFDVVEDYDVVFSRPRHGLYRFIRTRYDFTDESGRRENRKIKIKKIRVPGQKFRVSPGFVRNLENETEIKIGDKNKTVTGPQHYRIKYRVLDGFIFENSKTLFYWNIKPDGWKTVFEGLEFKIHLPRDVGVSPEDIFVYSGKYGSDSLSPDFDVVYSNGVFTAKSKSGFRSSAGESVTVLLHLPPDAIKKNSTVLVFWGKYGWIFILGAGLIPFFSIWRKYKTDSRSVVASITYFPPGDIDSAMAGFLIDDSADTPDLISLLPAWGARGILEIEEIPKKTWFGKSDIKLKKRNELQADAPAYEKLIFAGLFENHNREEVLVSELKDSFYLTMQAAKSQLKENAQIYYDAETRRMKTKVMIAIIGTGLILFFVFLFSWGLFPAIAVVLVAGILILLTTLLVRKNREGKNLLSELKGFRKFIRIAELNQLKMLLKEDPDYFETTMAYAVAFGLFERWAKKFDALDIRPPDWYVSAGGVYTMQGFASSFSGSIKTTQSTMVSSPSSSGSSSSGGGFSGGGFGGGGGGSW